MRSEISHRWHLQLNGMYADAAVHADTRRVDARHADARHVDARRVVTSLRHASASDPLLLIL